MDEGQSRALKEALGSVRHLCQGDPGPPEQVAARVSTALLTYLFDTADAVSLLLDQGATDQAAVLLRTALSTATNLRAIWRDPHEANRVALQYLLFSQQARSNRFKNLVREHEIDAALAEQLDHKERQRENDLVQRLEREHGIAPIKLGTRPDTWSGLSDRDLLSRVWGEDERYSDYADMSNASHANVAGIWHRLVVGGASPSAFTNDGIADAVVRLAESAAVAVAKGMGAGREEAIQTATNTYWWSGREGDDDDDLFGHLRPGKYDTEDEENPAR